MKSEIIDNGLSDVFHQVQKSKNTELVVLFCSKTRPVSCGRGVVVVGTPAYEVGSIRDDWLISSFEPLPKDKAVKIGN